MRHYRTTLLTCVTAWFLTGLHVPSLHHMTHDHAFVWPVIIAVMILVAVGSAGLWRLLRAAAPEAP